MRDEFWDTVGQGHYGGDVVIWQALRAAATAPCGDDAVILSAAGVLVPPAGGGGGGDVVVWDERGRKYELPPYVLSDPVR